MTIIVISVVVHLLQPLSRHIDDVTGQRGRGTSVDHGELVITGTVIQTTCNGELVIVKWSSMRLRVV